MKISIKEARSGRNILCCWRAGVEIKWITYKKNKANKYIYIYIYIYI